jgi:hypothetical protein
VSPGVCLLIGVPAGMAAFGVLTGDPLLIAGVPLLVNGVISVGPFAVLAGVMGGEGLLAFWRADGWNPVWHGWVLAWPSPQQWLSWRRPRARMLDL